MQTASGVDQTKPHPHPQQQHPQPSLPPSPQWMAESPYPTRQMMYPYHMIHSPHPYPHHYLQYPPAHQYHPLHHLQPGQDQGKRRVAGTSEENKTVWVGDLQYWMDESYLHRCFHHTGEVGSIKVIRNKHNGQSEGYGFVEFCSHAAAEKVLQDFNGIPMPNVVDIPFRLNWASFSMGESRPDNGSDLSIFVGDLASDVTDTILQETFASKYPSVKGAKVVIDANTGRPKGYGFVRFGEESEKTRAMNEMNGVYCSARPMRIGAATPRKSGGFAPKAFTRSNGDTTNTTIFVGGLAAEAKEEDLRQAFAQYGEISSVKIPPGKQCGFVQFVNRNNAEEALQKLNGTMICNQTVRLTWGRNTAKRQMRGDVGTQWNNQYYGGHVYDRYGYASPYSPAIYGSPYGPYPIYGNQQQVN